METDRELLPSAAAPSLLPPAGRLPAGDAVPMLRFLAGTCRATLALVRFLAEVVRADAPDPIDLTPRILRRV